LQPVRELGHPHSLLHGYHVWLSWDQEVVELIASFGDRATQSLFNGHPAKDIRRFPPPIVKVAIRKLDMLNAAADLRDLKSPPGNHLEALARDLVGFYSIRVNDQWRIVFRWSGSEAFDVRLADYH
jgi:proteic killer suppression protein